MKIYTDKEHTHNMKERTVSHYKVTYKQPWRNYIIAGAYHTWEKATWRILRLAEKLDWRKHDWYYIPFTNRQDIRCYHLHSKNRIELKRELIGQEPFERS